MKKVRSLIVYLSVIALLMGNFFVFTPVMAQGQAGTTLTATKTATGSWTRTFGWTIEKTVTPDTWDLFNGDTGTSAYAVKLTKGSGTDEVFVEGEVCVTNGGSVATENLAILDVIQTKIDGGAFSDYFSQSLDLSANPVLDPGESYCYPYKIEFTPVADALYKNVAEITITNHSGSLGTPFGPSPKADFSLPSSPTLVNDSVTVDDTNGSPFPQTVSDSTTINYDKTFACPGDQGKHENTATIEETEQQSSASVQVNCYALEVTKDAATSLTRKYSWTIEKSADQTNLTLALGEQFLVNYQILLESTFADSDWATNGNITVHNPAPMAATINDVTDTISGVGSALVSGSTFPASLSAESDLDLTYSTDLPDASTRTNTATAILQNYDYASDGTPTASGTTDFTGTASIDFANATVTEIDKTVDVADTLQGDLGTVSAGETPKIISYSLYVGGYEVCGNYQVKNTASFVTADTLTTGDSSWTIDINVPCAGGCTLTQGYWKTHSNHGPAPFDDTWSQITPSGADSPFFLSGKTWYKVLWTAPAGNAYYQLADQYIGTKLNMLGGAYVPPSVMLAFNSATNLFNTYTPAQIGALKGNNPLRAQFIALAGILGSYNEGLIGPGHCSQ